jgi:hypothetical protein
MYMDPIPVRPELEGTKHATAEQGELLGERVPPTVRGRWCHMPARRPIRDEGIYERCHMGPLPTRPFEAPSATVTAFENHPLWGNRGNGGRGAGFKTPNHDIAGAPDLQYLPATVTQKPPHARAKQHRIPWFHIFPLP